MCICSAAPRRDFGFTLPEVILLIVVTAVAFTGIMLAYVESTRASGDPQVRRQSVAIAESMLEEVLLMPFNNPPGACDPTTSLCGSRAEFNSLMDYSNYGPTSVQYIDGTAVPGLAGYTVEVDVTDEALGTVAAGTSKRVTVMVTAPQAQFNFTAEGHKLNCGTGC
jgi:MSHA pilin protein MshD